MKKIHSLGLYAFFASAILLTHCDLVTATPKHNSHSSQRRTSSLEAKKSKRTVSHTSRRDDLATRQRWAKELVRKWDSHTGIPMDLVCSPPPTIARLKELEKIRVQAIADYQIQNRWRVNFIRKWQTNFPLENVPPKLYSDADLPLCYRYRTRYENLYQEKLQTRNQAMAAFSSPSNSDDGDLSYHPERSAEANGHGGNSGSWSYQNQRNRDLAVARERERQRAENAANDSWLRKQKNEDYVNVYKNPYRNDSDK